MMWQWPSPFHILKIQIFGLFNPQHFVNFANNLSKAKDTEILLCSSYGLSPSVVGVCNT